MTAAKSTASRSASPARAAASTEAAPVITLDHSANVFVDGENVSQSVADYVRNHPEHAPQVDGALRQWVIDQRKETAAHMEKCDADFREETNAAHARMEKAIALAEKNAETERKSAEAAILARDARIGKLEKLIGIKPTDEVPDSLKQPEPVITTSTAGAQSGESVIVASNMQPGNVPESKIAAALGALIDPAVAGAPAVAGSNAETGAAPVAAAAGATPLPFGPGATLRDKNTGAIVTVAEINPKHKRTGNPRAGFLWRDATGFTDFVPMDAVGNFEVVEQGAPAPAPAAAEKPATK